MVYTINVPANAAGVIVNGQGGNKQTANITNFAPAGGGYYVDESKTEQNEFGATVYTAIPWGGDTPVETTTKKVDPQPTSKTIYFAAPTAWSAVDFFYGNSNSDLNAATKIAMTKTGKTQAVTVSGMSTVSSGNWPVYSITLTDAQATAIDAAKVAGFCKHGAVNRTGMRNGETIAFATETAGAYASAKAPISSFYGKTFIISGCYDTKYENRTYTGYWLAGSTPVVETTTKDTGAKSFKFTDSLHWGDIRLYAWDANQNAVTAQWPGNSGVQGETNEYGEVVYTINVPANAVGVIVNGQGGNKQTADITNFKPSGGYYVDEAHTSTNEFGATVYVPQQWNIVGSDTEEPTTKGNGGSEQGTTVNGGCTTKTFKFTDAMNWGDIRLYAWDANQNAVTAQWPGNSGVKGEMNDYGQMVYTITVPANAAGVIVNGAGGSKQTANITNFAPAGGGYYVDGSRTETNEFGQTVYTAIPWA
jgi:hypothetical protein